MWIGIDGEGKGRTPHKYTLLAASSESGSWSNRVYNSNGLSTRACLNFMCDIPEKRAFAFAFNYDLTKILADLDTQSLFFLLRPELRQSKQDGCPPLAVKWEEFTLNLQGTKFSVKRYGKDLTTVWDVFRFFQCKFTTALQDWKILDEQAIENMSAMKDKRGEFDHETDSAILEYCLSECRSMATLARKLTEAHTAANVRLKNYFGAGSTGAAILDDMGIKENIRNHIPYSQKRDLKYEISMFAATMGAFFGGRFENSQCGEIPNPVYSADISSAYPYQLCYLPCLEHGQWRFTTDRKEIDSSRAALINWSLVSLANNQKKRWGPFPFRTREGTILFPTEGSNGWTYKAEYLAGEKLFPNVTFVSAWVLDQECDCVPFPKIPHYYRERVRIGKNGPGIVFKLGPNSCYGKLAQSVGKPQYQSWLWAGMITSGCRAQILELMSTMTDIDNVLAIATDGIYSLEELQPITPLDTNTWETGKPLGGWELTTIEKGMFFARPGINFPLDDYSVISKVRGRGFGRKSIFDNRDRIKKEWNSYIKKVNLAIEWQDYPKVSFPSVQRFIGAKSATRRKNDPENPGGYIYTRDEVYGEWLEKDLTMSFNPAPKRAGFIMDERKDKSYPLGVWKLPADALSTPYKMASNEVSEEEIIMGAMKLVSDEQPDWTGALEG